MINTKRWIFKFSNKDQSEKVLALAKQTNLHEIISSILVQRDITDIDKAIDFFKPRLEKLYDPFLMKDMQKTVERVIQAIQNKEKILIYGDYDVDGTTAVAMVYSFMHNIGSDVKFYTPDRHIEGYGLSKAAIVFAKETHTSLIITLDCGTTDIDHIKLAKDSGIDTIICDHHEPGKILPDAHSILNPKQPQCPYPFKGLSGCGVAFKLLQALAQKMKLPTKAPLSHIDLVAVSIAADIVPIIDENRILTHFGILKLKNNPSIGIKAILEKTHSQHKISVSNLVFGVAPLINAAGRIAHANTAISTLLAQNTEIANTMAHNLYTLNATRKDIDNTITKEALRTLSQQPHNKTTTTLYNPTWHKGIIGIVASRCIEHYYRPTIILTKSNGKATGSARSITGFNLYDALTKCADLLDRYGGHEYAAGLTLPIDNIPLLQQRFEDIANKTIHKDHLLPTQTINAKMPIQDIDNKFYNILKRMAPFGPGNMQPVFYDNSVVAHDYTILKNQHIKIKIKKPTITIDAIGFGMAYHEDKVKNHKPFQLAYSIDEDTYLGQNTLCLKIRDIKPIS